MSRISVELQGSTHAWHVPEEIAQRIAMSFEQVGAKEDEIAGATNNMTSGVGTLIEQLKDKQHEVCAYGTREGDGGTCDCKYTDRMFLGEAFELRGERTGCCELRAAIQILEKLNV